MTKFEDGWAQLEAGLKLRQYDFDNKPLLVDAVRIKELTNNKEPRLLCSQDSREGRPQIFQELGLFMLPVRNGAWVILRGEGYIDLPPAHEEAALYTSTLEFTLDTAKVDNSLIQHLDFAYATSLVQTFMQDDSLLLTIRGRERSPDFSLRVGQHQLDVQGVQTEIDAGYEGRGQIVLVEAKNSKAQNLIIRQLYYPFRLWTSRLQKPVRLLIFENCEETYTFWQYSFTDRHDYNSIHLERTGRYVVQERFSALPSPHIN